ncbi:Do family serine endopeptidase [Microvirga arabica]|uniref:Do family serine endopeptidase n=1 Tax=Microvirga arabica TaxID=1128671 RepID=UPI00193A46A2|nr:Do family serine endopeptidase [Microvirga arabica]MBM1172807.1 Do family serine endopeptidase [Microvirga arabica]
MSHYRYAVSDSFAHRQASPIKAYLLGAAALAAVATGLFAAPQQSLAQGAPSQQAAPAAQMVPSFADVIDRVKPAVVSVKVEVDGAAAASNSAAPSRPDSPNFSLPDDHPFQEFFRRFRGGNENARPGPQPSPRRGGAQGSGFFISADGYLVTNNHVVDNGSKVQVLMDDGRTLDAKVVGTDPKTDIALLKVEGSNLPFVPFAAETPRIGDWVLAVGNPFGLGGTVTAGIVSARGRDIGAGPYDDFIQIDAPVNRGNSGGPTFNQRGEVVGVNTAIASPSGGNVGIAFAIPAETVQSVVAELKEKGRVDRGYLGAQIQTLTKDIATATGLEKAEGAIVAELAENSPAAQAGIKTGDVVLSVNGNPVKSARDLSRHIASLDPNTTATVEVWRDGSRRTIDVKLGSLPDEKAASAAPASQNTPIAKLGLKLSPATGGKKGVAVAEVEPNSPASERGFRVGDVIAEVAGQQVQSPADVQRAIEESRKSGRKAVLFRVEAQNGSRFIAVQVPAA